MSIRGKLVCFLWLAVAVTSAYTQGFQGGIRGAVTDSVGAVIPGVEVTLTNESTNVPRTTVSNEVGQYVFSAVAPGAYKVKAALPGFKTFDRSGINVGTQQFINIDVTMQPGAVTEEVQVVADAPLVETATASTGAALPSMVLSTLPNTGRNAFMTSLIVPTVVHNGNPFYVRQQDQTNSSLLSLGGGPMRGNNYLLDGVPITDLRNRAIIIPSIEAVSEIKVQVNTYDAEMGRTGGGVFNTTMKSGGNNWHGAGFIQQRPQPWSAKYFFDTKKADFQYWLFGGAAGGPIQKDKTFFWAATEGYKTGTPRAEKLSVPTLAMRQGDFSGVAKIFDPTTTRPDPNRPGQFTRTEFDGDRIPANRMSPVGKALIKYWPEPNQPGFLNNFVASDVLHDVADQITAKADHNFNARNTINGTFLWYFSHEPFAVFNRGTPGEIADQNNYKLFRKVYAPVINYTSTLSNTEVLTLRYGYSQFQDDCDPASAGFDVSSLGFDSTYVGAVPIKQFPGFTFDDYRNLGASAGAYNYKNQWVSHNFLANYAKLIGRHDVRVGGAYRQIGVNFTDNSESTGVFSFDKVFTQSNPTSAASGEGNAIASLLLGYPASGRLTTPAPFRFFTRYYSGYIQDDFRMTHNLTFNAGVRYEYETDLMEKDNHIVVGFDRNATNPVAAKVTDPTIKDRIRGGLMYAGVNSNPRHQGDPQKLGFQPRFGLAYQVTPRTVIRAGYGIFFAPLQLFFPSSTGYGGIGYAATTDYLATTDGNRTPAGVINNPFPAGLRQPTGNTLGLLQNVGSSVRFVDQDNKRGYTQQYSLDIQRELPGGVAFTVGYVGSRLLHISVGGTSSPGSTGTAMVNINQLPVSLLALGPALSDPVANPFFGIPEAGELSRNATIERGKLLRPFPEFGDVLMVRASLGYGYYNSLTLKAERRLDNTGIGFRASYTFAKMLDNYFGDSSYYGQRAAIAIDNYDLRREYGLSLQDVRHRFVVSPLWDLPFGKGKPWGTGSIADRIAGGWNISPVLSFQTGMPASIWQNNNNAGTLGGIQRPNVVLGVDPCTSGTTTQRLDKNTAGQNWFNPAAFTQAPQFTLGNAPRTLNCRIAHQFNLDAAIRKNVRLRETSQVSFRLEILNLTNTPKFLNPEMRLGRGTFGTITAQAGFPRIIQYMIRYEF
jgi:trimeric autotransporter adhesin